MFPNVPVKTVLFNDGNQSKAGLPSSIAEVNVIRIVFSTNKIPVHRDLLIESSVLAKVATENVYGLKKLAKILTCDQNKTDYGEGRTDYAENG